MSYLVGLLIDKFLYHLPLYRQHQRLEGPGIKLSRETLQNLVHRTAELLEPVYYSLLSSILASKVLLMDETPMKAGNKSKGKMRTGYFWPVYGEEMGRKNYLFCWTEVGARYAGIIYSLICSCRLQGIDPYTYLVDVLQRIDSHPAIDVHMLTARIWKNEFADNPLRSDIAITRQ